MSKNENVKADAKEKENAIKNAQAAEIAYLTAKKLADSLLTPDERFANVIGPWSKLAQKCNGIVKDSEAKRNAGNDAAEYFSSYLFDFETEVRSHFRELSLMIRRGTFKDVQSSLKALSLGINKMTGKVNV